MATVQCVACPRRSTQTRTLPANEERRREWLLRLNLLDEEFMELSRKCEQLHQENRRARLCHAHFHNSKEDDYPIDRRILGDQPPTLFEQDHDQEIPSSSTRVEKLPEDLPENLRRELAVLKALKVAPPTSSARHPSDAGSSSLHSAHPRVSLTDNKRVTVFDPTASLGMVPSLSIMERKEHAERKALTAASAASMSSASTRVDPSALSNQHTLSSVRETKEIIPELISRAHVSTKIAALSTPHTVPSASARKAYADGKAILQPLRRPAISSKDAHSSSTLSTQPTLSPSRHRNIEERREIIPEPIPRVPAIPTKGAASTLSPVRKKIRLEETREIIPEPVSAPVPIVPVISASALSTQPTLLPAGHKREREEVIEIVPEPAFLAHTIGVPKTVMTPSQPAFPVQRTFLPAGQNRAREIVPEPIPRVPYLPSKDEGSDHPNPSIMSAVRHNRKEITPEETAEWIEQCKRLIDDVSDDIAMSTVFTASFDLLKDLCTKEINTQNFADDLEQMEVHRKLTMKYDKRTTPTSSEPLRKPVYALSESLQRTAQVLMTKNSFAPVPTVHNQGQGEFQMDYGHSLAAFSMGPQAAGPSQMMPQNFTFYPAPKTRQGAGGGRKKVVYEGEQVFHCPICPENSASGRVERTLRNVQAHLRSKHNKTAAAANVNLVCECGFAAQNFEKIITHGRKCKVFHVFLYRLVDESTQPSPFALLKTYRELPPIPIAPSLNEPATSSEQEVIDQFVCPFCRSTVQRSLNNLHHHMVDHHRRTIKQAGLCLVCSCGHTTYTSADACQHRKTCHIGSFSIHHSG